MLAAFFGVLSLLGEATTSAGALGQRSFRGQTLLLGGHTSFQGIYDFGVVGGHGKFTSLERRVPAPVAGINGQVIEVASSNSDNYALTLAGAVWAWGAGGYGELGDGGTAAFVRRPVEVQFPTGVKIASLANPMPYNSGLAIDTKGDLWGWGFNSSHSLCLPGSAVLRPEQLPASHVALASGAGDHTLFESDGSVYACGLGADGELGDGSMLSSATPIRVHLRAGLSIDNVCSGGDSTYAVDADGQLWAWGGNDYGQLGIGSRARRVPRPIRVGLSVTQISSTASNVVVLGVRTVRPVPIGPAKPEKTVSR